tara:strand:+ start:52 stop:528 length:477 start_codon:yes stop_codon:yes gene_type:complete
MTTTITGATGIDNIQAATGSVLQVVSATSNGSLSTNSTSFVDLITCNITPKSTSSKILVTFNSGMGYQNTANVGFRAHYTIFRDSTDLGNGDNGHTGTYVHTINYNDIYVVGNCHELDSPSTTSQITYKIKVRVDVSSAVIDFGWKGKDSITLMEIAG